jgi:hypothetical protein
LEKGSKEGTVLILVESGLITFFLLVKIPIVLGTSRTERGLKEGVVLIPVDFETANFLFIN